MSVDILLTGAGGQLGWEVARRVRAPLTIKALSRSQLDITDRDLVFNTISAISPKVVINGAAYTAVDKAEADPKTAFAVNRDGPRYLAEACSYHDIPLIHVSTDYIFDGSKAGSYSEDDPAAPLGIYGESKWAGEVAVREGCARHVVLRTSWVHGIHGNNFVKAMLRLAQSHDHIKVVDDQYGSPTFAGDLAEVVIIVSRLMIDGNLPQNGIGTFHCAGAGVTTWCNFAREIFKITKPEIVEVPVIQSISSAEYPTPSRRPINSALDCQKLAVIYGISLRPWEEALAEMLDGALAADTLFGGP